jgi:N-acetylglucosamine-6-phosphate deacetylase
VIVDKEKRVSLKNSPGLLAGAAKTLLENVEYLLSKNLATLSEVWQLASANAAKMLAKNDDAFNYKNDKVIFQLNGKEIQVMTVIKNGEIVFDQ